LIAQEREREVRAEGSDDEHLGVGEVDQAEHAVDQRVSDGHQCVDRTVGQAVHGVGPEQILQQADVEVDPLITALGEINQLRTQSDRPFSSGRRLEEHHSGYGGGVRL
jgi:hypothetical protein